MTKYEKHVAMIRKRCLSEIETGEDGYKCWWPPQPCGYLNATDLRIIADYLDELNKDWDEEVQIL